MDITVTRQYRKKEGVVSNAYNYSGGTQSNGSSGGVAYVPTPPAIISFTQTQYPSVLNYQEDYASLYGPWPRVQLFTFEESTESGIDDVLLERHDKPKRNIAADVLASIVWDLGYEDSGIIILYPTV
ncbi:MAG: hypothetical protein WC827_03890 [Candidatus Paceibacterota bacterium]|jgi:hypothetical protein